MDLLRMHVFFAKIDSFLRGCFFLRVCLKCVSPSWECNENLDGNIVVRSLRYKNINDLLLLLLLLGMSEIMSRKHPRMMP